jgi:TetR/AcrR family transcriptional repressor of nem operon
MAKSSKHHAAENRQAIVDAASELFRAQGFRGTSVPELMQAANMTHGGFYGHFASKEALAGEALDGAFDWLEGWVDAIATGRDGDPAAARADLVATYLKPEHRDAPALGCPVAALAGDVAREPIDSPLRTSFGRGIEAVVAQLTGNGMEQDEQAALADYATLVGALLLARATAGRPISDKLLTAAKVRLTGAA